MTHTQMPAQIVRTVADAMVEELSRSGSFFAMMLNRTPERIGSASFADADRAAALGRGWQKQLEAIDPARLSHTDELLRRRALHEADALTALPQRHLHSFLLTPYQIGMVAMAGGEILQRLKLRSTADGDQYLALLDSYAIYFDELRDHLVEQRKRSVRYPAAALPGSVATVRGLMAGFATALTPNAARLAELPAGDASRLLHAIERRIAERIRPAAVAALEELEGPTRESATDRVGLSQYNEGADVYAGLARYHTTLDLTPDALHCEGEALVAELEAKMAELRVASGFNGDQDSFHAMLATDPRVHATTPEEVGDLYRRHLGAVESHFARWFGARSVPPYDVRRLSPAAEAGMTFGYYQPPSRDGEAKGYYNYNGSDLANRSTIGAASLALHEIVPGHHLHLATDIFDDAKHPLRRIATVTAYNEGWAEYAADLGWEMGIYENELDQYGRLVMKLFLAARLVADTGLNAFGWSLERARAYMRAHSMMSEVEIASETLRYATSWPGQALGYAVGCSRLWDLRRDCERAQGDRFDVVAFHDAVFDGSSMPLGDLRWYVTERLAVKC